MSYPVVMSNSQNLLVYFNCEGTQWRVFVSKSVLHSIVQKQSIRCLKANELFTLGWTGTLDKESKEWIRCLSPGMCSSRVTTAFFYALLEKIDPEYTYSRTNQPADKNLLIYSIPDCFDEIFTLQNKVNFWVSQVLFKNICDYIFAVFIEFILQSLIGILIPLIRSVQVNIYLPPLQIRPSVQSIAPNSIFI
jgi:hypothetical protein